MADSLIIENEEVKGVKTNLLNEYKSFDTIVMDSQSYCSSNFVDTLSFTERTQRDDYNLEIYSKLLNFFGQSFPCKKINKISTKTIPSKKSYVKILIDFFLNTVSYMKFNKKTIFLQNSYFDKKTILNLLFFSRFKIKIKFY